MVAAGLRGPTTATVERFDGRKGLSMYTIVRDVFDPDRAAEAAEQAGNYERALLIRRNGKGCQVVTDDAAWLPQDPSREQVDRVLERLSNAFALPGTRFHARIDFDPDWSKQYEAMAVAMGEVWRHRELRRLVAVPALNAFKRSYYGHASHWDLADPTERPWPAADRRNFSDGARRMANAIAGMRLVDGTAPPGHLLLVVLSAGWRAAESDKPEASNGQYTAGSLLELTYGLAYTMRRHGEPHLDWLVDAVQAGSNGNS